MRLMLIFAVVAVAGCSMGEPRDGGGQSMSKMALDCTGGAAPGACVVVVNKKCPWMVCSGDVSHDPIRVHGGGNRIQWVLGAPNLNWRGAGIVPAPASGIQCNAPTGNVVQCSNAGTPSPDPRGWKYTVMLEGVPDLDPWIINN